MASRRERGSNTDSLDGTRVIVTGAGDIGSAITGALRRRGARVCTWDVSGERLASIADETGESLTRVVDVTVPDSVDAATREFANKWGGVDGLVNSAGVLSVGPFTELAVEEWLRVINVNLTGVFLCCRAVIPLMVTQGGGSIVNISSVSGLRGTRHFAAYAASKFGVIGLTQALAQELGERGIRVNAVCPGAVESSMNDEIVKWSRASSTVDLDEGEIIRRTPLGQLVQVDDVAAAVRFLLSADARLITGEALAVAGGLSA